MAGQDAATNLKRARWAAVAVRAFQEETGNDDAAEAVQDLLSDLMHLCNLDFRLPTFETLQARAYQHWLEEVAEEREIL